jgi:hypothetical protein
MTPLRYIGLFAKTREDLLVRLTLEMNSHLRLPLTTTFIIYQKSGPTELIEIFGDMTTFATLGIESGSFLVFQLARPATLNLPECPLNDRFVEYFHFFPSELPFTADKYFASMNDSFQLTIETPNCEKEIKFPCGFGWDQFKAFLSKLFDNHFHPNLEVMYFYLKTSVLPVDESLFDNVGKAFSKASRVFVLTVPSSESEWKLRIVTSFSVDGVSTHRVSLKLFPPDATARDLLDSVRQTQGIERDIKLRALLLHKSGIVRVLNESERLVALTCRMRVEIVPRNQLKINPGELLVSIERLIRKGDGELKIWETPFMFKVIGMEPLKKTRGRLMEILPMSEEDWMWIEIGTIAEDGEFIKLPDTAELAKLGGEDDRIVMIFQGKRRDHRAETHGLKLYL